jgi:capsular polysaccharide biosynthesis protein
MRYDVRKTAILEAGAFDNAHYLDQALAAGVADLWDYPSLLDHYLSAGWKRRLNPSRDFDVGAYLDGNPLVRQAGIEPLSRHLWQNARPDAPSHRNLRPITIVVGMHRSGASLCANILGILGVDMCERSEVVEFHDRILEALDRKWDDRSHMLSLPSGWCTKPGVRAIRDEMTAWLAEHVPHTAHFGFNDPRTARLLALWDEICAELQLDPRYVFCVREPAEVARLLVARNGIARREAEYRWMMHSAETILGIGGRPLCIIAHEDWFGEPGRNLARLAAHLGLERALESDVVATLLKAAVDRAPPNEEPEDEAAPLAAALYRQIANAAGEGHVGAGLRDAAARFLDVAELIEGSRAVGSSAPADALRSVVDRAAALGLDAEVIDGARGGDLIQRMRVKKALVARHGIEQGFVAFRELFDIPDTARLHLRPVRSLRAVAAERSIVFHEMDPGGEPFVVKPPTVFGEGNQRELNGISRSIFVACLADARVRGGSAFVEMDGLALLDYEGDELSRVDDNLDLDPAVFAAEGGVVWMAAPENDVCSIELDEAFCLLGPHSDAFGHWIWEYLPKVIAGLLSGKLPPVPVLIDEAMPVTHRQALALLAPKGTQIVEIGPSQTVLVHRLWCAPSQMYMPLLEEMNERWKIDYIAPPPVRLAVIVEAMRSRLFSVVAAQAGDERIYLARRDYRHRKLINHDAIEAMALAHGFRVVYPEDRDFAAQIALVREARLILAANGSAVMLAMFARPGTRLCVLTHPYTLEQTDLSAVLRELGIEPTMFVGAYATLHKDWEHLSDYEIDETRFADFLDAWIRGTESGDEHAAPTVAVDHAASWGFEVGLPEAAQGTDLTARMKIKQALVERYGVERGFAAFCNLLALPHSEEVRLRPLASLRVVAAERAIVFRELAAYGKPFVIRPSNVFGEGNHRELNGVARSCYVACFADALVSGQSAFIEVDGLALLDYEADELSGDILQYDPAIFAAQNGEVWLTAPKDDVGSITLVEAFTLLGPYSHVFGHWLLEYLPKFLMASMSGELPAMPVLIGEDMPPQLRESLELLVPEGTQIVQLGPFHTARVRRLWCAPSPSYAPVFDRVSEKPEPERTFPPAYLGAIAQAMRSRLATTVSGTDANERIFLARKPHQHRKLINHHVIEAVAQARGFRIVYPEDLSFAEQIRMVRGARLILAPSGSAALLGMFAQPGTKLCLLNHPYTVEHMDMMALLNEVGVEASMFSGRYVSIVSEWPDFSDYEIDEARFAHFLDAWIRSAGTGDEGAASRETLSALASFRDDFSRSGWLPFELMRLKGCLAQQLGVERGFTAWRDGLRMLDLRPFPVEEDEHIGLKPLLGLREFALRQADFFLELDPGGRPFVVPQPNVIGESNCRELEGISRSIFVTCLNDVRLRGWSAFIDTADAVLLEYQADELHRMDDNLAADPSVFQASGESAWAIELSEGNDVMELDTAFTLIGPHTNDFGHWMWEYLPRYIVATASGVVPPMPVLIDEAMPATHRQALELLVPPGTHIVTLPTFRTVRVRRLWCATGQVYVPILESRNERLRWEYFAAPPARFAPIIREMARRAEIMIPPGGGNERVYLARQSWRRRKLLNHAEVEDVARARGFCVVYPEELDFQDQVRLLRDAQFVLGPDGSAFYLAFFAQPGTRVCTLSHPFAISTQSEQACFLSAAGMDVTFVTGPGIAESAEYPDFQDYTIDLTVLDRFLDEWLASERVPPVIAAA